MSSFESIRQLRFPPEVESRFHELIERKAMGQITAMEQRELGLLLEACEGLVKLRAKAERLAQTANPPNGDLKTIMRNGLPVAVVPAGTPMIDPAAVRRCLEEEGF